MDNSNQPLASIVVPGTIYHFDTSSTVRLQVDSLSGGDTITIAGAMTGNGSTYPLDQIENSTTGAITTTITANGIYDIIDAAGLWVTFTHVGSASTPILTTVSRIWSQITSVILVAPSAPSLTATAGNGQVTISWTDGANGGAAITQRLLYTGTTSGAEGAGIPITLTGGQYVLTGLTNAQSYFFRGAIRTSVDISPLSAEISATPVAQMAMPQTAAIVGRWRTDSITPVANGTPITSWTDSISGQVLSNVSGSSPTYLNSGGIGAPALACNSTQWLFGAATQSMAAISSNEYTMMVVASNIGNTGTGHGYMVGITDSGAGCLIANGTSVTSNQSNSPYTSQGFTTLMSANSNSSGYGLAMVNGGCFAYASGTYTPSQLGVGATRQGVAGAICQIYEVIFWNRKLTLAEAVQAERSLRDHYAQPYPWTAPGYYYVAMGDSITAGKNLSGPRWTVQLAQSLSMPVGSYSNLAVTGTSPPANLASAQAENTAGISAVTGVPTKYSYFEFYNSSAGVASPYGTCPHHTQIVNILSYFKSTSADKVAFGTATTYAGAAAAGLKAILTNYWDSAVTPAATSGAKLTGLIDCYVPIHQNALIGQDSAITQTTVSLNASAPTAAYGAAWDNTISETAFTGSITSGSSAVLTLGSTPSANLIVGGLVRWAGSPTVPVALGALISGTANTSGATYHITGTVPATVGSQTIYLDLGDGIHPSDYGASIMAPLWNGIATM